jgi:chromosome segregation ATPase
MRKRVTTLNKKSKAQEKSHKVEGRGQAQRAMDKLHQRIRAKLDELRTDFGKLKDDLHDADQASSRARKDRIEGLKRALNELLEAADRAQGEWH